MKNTRYWIGVIRITMVSSHLLLLCVAQFLVGFVQQKCNIVNAVVIKMGLFIYFF